MIRSLRKRHQRIFWLVFLVLPPVFIVGLFNREPIPTVQVFPEALQPLPKAFSQTWETIAEDGDFSALLKTQQSSNGWKLQVKPLKEAAFPDVLVYLAIEKSPDITPQSLLLGGMSGAQLRQFHIPQQMVEHDAYILFYSLGIKKMVASLRLPAVATKPRR